MNYKKEYLYKKIVFAKQFLDKSYQDDISLDILINEANISKYHFIRLFKNTYGITPHKYLTEKRLKIAKMELESTKESVSDICFKVGFSSVSSFCNLFKKVTRQTPLEYRNTFIELKKNRFYKPLENIPGCYGLIHHS
ncbi:MAG TPA: AraC family transcriptional regulator [Flavobacteriaceae bacterium]|nr:AraC family transcriptional regulator [Flavobacteriaceae bacterium]